MVYVEPKCININNFDNKYEKIPVTLPEWKMNSPIT